MTLRDVIGALRRWAKHPPADEILNAFISGISSSGAPGGRAGLPAAPTNKATLAGIEAFGMRVTKGKRKPLNPIKISRS